MQKTNNIAIHGGTDAPGTHQAFFATDEAALSVAFSQIVANSFLLEVCDGVNNDCDNQIDEGFELYCDLDGGHTAEDLCVNPGDACDGTDDNCFAGTTDEVTNTCGTCWCDAGRDLRPDRQRLRRCHRRGRSVRRVHRAARNLRRTRQRQPIGRIDEG